MIEKKMYEKKIKQAQLAKKLKLAQYEVLPFLS